MCELLSIDNNITNNSQELCKHGAFIENKCAICNRLKEECNNNNNVTTIPFRYIDQDFSLTMEAIHHLRARNFETLIKNKKLHLVLDLDHTLLHSIKGYTLEEKEKIKSSYEDVHEILDGTRLVKLRPGAREFLVQASVMFELSIYTMAEECYAKEVAKVLRSKVCQKMVRFENVISKEDCTRQGRKGLDVLLSDERVVLIVDDLEEVWGDECRDNLIKIMPYKFFMKESPWVHALFEDDLELSRVLGVLKKVHSMFYEEEERSYGVKDVREVLERVKNESLVVKE